MSRDWAEGRSMQRRGTWKGGKLWRPMFLARNILRELQRGQDLAEEDGRPRDGCREAVV